MEEYFPADRLLQLSIGSVIHINNEKGDLNFTVSLVGVDQNNSVICTLPLKSNLPEGSSYQQIFIEDTMFEMKTIHDGRVVAFESTVKGLYGERLLIGSYPEMIETRRLRRDVRFPCALSCDIRFGDNEAYGAITNISSGGCQLSVAKNKDYTFIEKAVNSQRPINLEVFFPYSDSAFVISADVKSASCTIDGECTVGLSFNLDYECVQKYLESLQLDSVAPFFS